VAILFLGISVFRLLPSFARLDSPVGFALGRLGRLSPRGCCHFHNPNQQKLQEKNTHESEFYEQDHAVPDFEHFTGCHWMQRAVDQRGIGRFASAHAHGAESRGSDVDIADRKQFSPAEALAIQNISAEASKDLTLLQSLYSRYKANPNAGTLQKIEYLIQDTSQSLPALLQAAHISNPALSSRITAAVNLILTTVNRFAALIPRAAPSAATASRMAIPTTSQRNASVPQPGDLKKQWNLQVCGPAGDAALDAALAERCHNKTCSHFLVLGSWFAVLGFELFSAPAYAVFGDFD
jgi:hypothetical protein